MPPQDVFALCVAAGLVVIYGRIWFRRHREAPLRRVIRARDVTFRAIPDQVKVSDPGGLLKWAAVNVTGASFGLMGLLTGDLRYG